MTIHKLVKTLKLRKACWLDGILNECLRDIQRRPLVHLTHLLSHFQKPWEKAKVKPLSKPSKNPKFPQNLCPISLLSTRGKLLDKVILRIVQRHIEERGLLNASHFGFRDPYSTTLQCMKLIDLVTLNFNINISTAVVFLDIKKAFDTTRHLGLLYKLLELKFLIRLIKLTRSFLFQRKFRVSVESKMSAPSDIRAVVPQSSVLSPTLCCIYKWYVRNAWCLSRSLCWWHLYICNRPHRG
jgi:hypothetical protein